MPYNANYKTTRHISLSILKQFGFGKRIMESRIQVEVNELVIRAKILRGKPFNPDLLVMACVLNVIHSILFGTRLDQSRRSDPQLYGQRMSGADHVSDTQISAELSPKRRTRYRLF